MPYLFGIWAVGSNAGFGVYDYGGSTPPPVADFEGSPTGGYWPLGVTFMDLSTNSPTGWAWDFGDGSPTGTEQNPYHTYTGVGTYTVEMTATNDGGSDTETKTDYIEVLTDAPNASFYMNKTSGYAPLTVRFTDTSTSLSPLASWYWTFGDGHTSTDQNPSHLYTAPGVYTITLTVTNTAARTDTETKTRVLLIALTVLALRTHDMAPPQTDEILSHMISTGDGTTNIYSTGIKYSIPDSAESPDPAGFRRPAGPSLIFD